MEFPLRIKRAAECYRIEDAQGRALHLYYEENELRRSIMKRWTRQEAEEIAIYLARKLSEDRAIQLRMWEIANPPMKKPRF
ncbi:hypothetical protein [Bosea sp. (in: a-proteobacteria)]|uniref:hypothetical protein n=1 Tax=Bosea sp. (in: a-proteobacteria) TaxID=1871050 RepID=UPI003B3A54C7